MKTAVVTGATGFIGGALTRHLLSEGYQVTAVGRKPADWFAENGVAFVEAEFSQYENLAENLPAADIFYHFAWDGISGVKTVDFALQLENARWACEALVQAAKAGCGKFVLAGTVAELEVLEHIDQNVCRPRGTCIYAMAKLTAEMMCKTLAAERDIAFNCGLFANIYGPGDKSRRSTNIILGKLVNHEAPKLVKGDGLNDWLYIKDAVRLLQAMGEKGVPGKSYYIGHRDLWPLRKIVERARDIVAPDLSLIFGEISDEFLTDYSYISTGELYEDTGCKAEYSFERAIRETAAWVRTLDI